MMKKYSYEIIAAIVGLILGVVVMLAASGELNGTVFAVVAVAVFAGFADLVYSRIMGTIISVWKFIAGFVPALIGIALVNLFS